MTNDCADSLPQLRSPEEAGETGRFERHCLTAEELLANLPPFGHSARGGITPRDSGTVGFFADTAMRVGHCPQAYFARMP